ncbi:hypothetical protein Gotri_025485 [Gossypium trilobum]|uniref:Myb/SANT-like domain-containing protein n=1 Tax=Gossypium trilobum TaxID=34281 RepID=A0A7J9FJV8_9ROSI|nr:hypothetical protein [Gossypium trilobum]
MSLDPIEAELGEGLPSNVIHDDEPNTVNIHLSDAWATWRMELANQIGKDNSGFGWDEHRQLVIVENVVWNSYISAKTTTDIIEE